MARAWARKLAVAGLAPVLVAGLVSTAEAKPPRATSVTAEITGISCAQGQATGVTYTLWSSSATVGVEVRWRVFTGQIIEFGSTYVSRTYNSVPTGTTQLAPAPTGYQLTEVTVIPLVRNGGTADSERLICSAG